MLDASVVFLIIITVLVTVIWIKGNIGDRLGRVVIDQNKKNGDLDNMEREVSIITQHVGSTFRRGSQKTEEAKKSKDENDNESGSAKKRDSSGNKSVDADQGDGSKGRKKDGSRRKKNRQK